MKGDDAATGMTYDRALQLVERLHKSGDHHATVVTNEAAHRLLGLDSDSGKAFVSVLDAIKAEHLVVQERA